MQSSLKIIVFYMSDKNFVTQFRQSVCPFEQSVSQNIWDIVKQTGKIYMLYFAGFYLARDWEETSLSSFQSLLYSFRICSVNG